MNGNLMIQSSQLPASLANLFTDAAAGELGGGIQAGFPVVSFRGRVWRIKAKGEEHIIKDQDGQPRPSIELVLLAANPHLSKLYYDSVYQEGDDAPPSCWSIDGIKPDSQVESPQCATCAACPQNVWGSKITPQGTKVKACADSKRVACVPAGDLEGKTYGGPMLLRIPAASLQGLLQYSSGLTNQGVPFFAVVTRLSFDLDASYPKLECTPLRVVNEAEAETIARVRASDDVRRILATMEEPEAPAPAAPETPPVVTTPGATPVAAAPPVAPPAAAPTPPAPPVAPAPAPAPADDGIYDVNGVRFDPAIHASKDGVTPTLNPSGTFRKRRSDSSKAPAAPPAAPEENPVGMGHAGETLLDSELEEPTAPPAAPPSPTGGVMDDVLGDVLGPLNS